MPGGIRKFITPADLERFTERVPFSGCWLWTGGLASGYGRINGRMLNGGQKICWQAHRISYVFRKGAIPDGLDLDHLCRVRSCINPDHLEPVTRRVNILRGLLGTRTHCPQGHEKTAENTLWKTGPQGYKKRLCRKCGAARSKQWKFVNPVKYTAAYKARNAAKKAAREKRSPNANG